MARKTLMIVTAVVAALAWFAAPVSAEEGQCGNNTKTVDYVADRAGRNRAAAVKLLDDWAAKLTCPPAAGCPNRYDLKTTDKPAPTAAVSRTVVCSAIKVEDIPAFVQWLIDEPWVWMVVKDPSGRQWHLRTERSGLVSATAVDPPRPGHEYVWHAERHAFVPKTPGAPPASRPGVLAPPQETPPTPGTPGRPGTTPRPSER